ncbi:MAG TPA: multidrug effflux MFS transporter [Cytophagaceae bacterium]|nr:multidrug effflux MFS transporter [Cytophagaceae bacterium]
MTKQTYLSLILILGTLTALVPFTVDMYLPGFPGIAKDLHTDVASVGLSLSSFFIGISLGQLLYGPLLDRYGRKMPLYCGLLVYVIASISCIWVTNITELIILRFVQAIGSCVAGVASMAMVRDLFPVKDSAKVFSLLMLMVGLSPMLAPTIGGYVTAEAGWHAVFLTLAGMGVFVILAVFFFLPNSYTPDTTISLKPTAIIGNFMLVLREPAFYTYAFTGAIAFGGLFAYVASSPLVFMEVFHVNGKVYGWIFAFLSIAFIGSNQINTLLLSRYRSEQIVKASLIAMCSVMVLFLILTISGVLGLYGTITFLFLYLCFLGLINPNTAALSLAPFSKNAGSASALLGALQMCMGTVASVGVSVFTTPSVIPMISIIGITSLGALAILVIGKRKSNLIVSDHSK